MISLGLKQKLYLGNLNAKRDWGYAPEYCEGMWKILQQKEPDDFLLATGETHTVREFCEHAFKELGIELEWHGKDENEKGIIKAISSGSTSNLNIGDVVVEVDPRYYRPTEVDILIGDASKAKEKLDWQPKVRFEKLVKIMVQADRERVQNQGA